MPELIGDAVVRVTADVAKFQKGMSGVQKRFRGVMTGLGRAAKRAGIAIGVGLVAGIALSIKAAAKQEAAETKLAAVLKATGNAAGISAKEMKKHAAELQKVTKFGDETIINTQAILATFKEIKGDEFKEATGLILDMSEVLGQDAKAGAIGLGKALNDPIKGVSALSRVGVSFTEQQKKQITTLQESGDIMGAQAVILQELQSEFGGAAEAAGKTTAGAFAQLKNAIGDTLEQVGFMITESTAFRDLLVGLKNRTEAWTEKLKKLKETDFLERMIMQVRLFLVNFTSAFKKIWIIAKGTFMAIAETIGFVFKTLGVGAANAWIAVTETFKGGFSNIKALWKAVLNFFKTGQFVMPELKTFDDVQAKLVKMPEAPTKAWEKMHDDLTKLEKDSADKRAKIGEDFARQVEEKNKRLAEKEAADAIKGGKAVVGAEDKKQKARKKTASQWLQAADVIKNVQERLNKEAEKTQAGVRARVAGPAAAAGAERARPGQQQQVQQAVKTTASKAAQQRQKVIGLLGKIEKKEFQPQPVFV